MTSLTTAQIATLKAAVLADPVASVYLNQGNDTALRDWFNTETVKVVWKTHLPESDITDLTGSGGTTWNWTTYIGRSVAEKAAWERMVARGYINPSLSQVRAGCADIFSGTAQTAVAMRDHLTAMSQRFALTAESILAVGVGTTLSPATMAWEGAVSASDVIAIRTSP